MILKAQRGFQVYKEVCSACHSLRLVAFRDLGALGYNEAEVKAIAKGLPGAGRRSEHGEETMRPGMSTDFHLLGLNDIAARAANNNAVPPISR